MNLISIRKSEISYFANFFTTFSIQSALIVGTIVSTISQTPVQHVHPDLETTAPPFFRYVYFIATALSFVCAMNGLLSTIFINIFGLGLALRGPPGSMVRAVEGMVEEQLQVLISFVVTIVFFMLMTVGMFFEVMNETIAPVASVIIMCSMGITYHFSLRIYNRFQIPNEKLDWRKNTENTFDEAADPSHKFFGGIGGIGGLGGGKKASKELTNPLTPGTTFNRTASKSKVSSSILKAIGISGITSRGRKTSRASLGSLDDDSLGDDKYEPPTVVATNDAPIIAGDGRFSDVDSQVVSAELNDNFFNTGEQDTRAIGAYLSYYQQPKAILFTSDPWIRRYFVIKGGIVFYYQDKFFFQDDPGKPINRRGIDLEGYTIQMDETTPGYIFQLVVEDPEDNRRDWKFRCDTQDEFERWVNLFRKAIQEMAPALQMNI